MTKKIMDAKNVVDQLQHTRRSGGSMIRQIYMHLLGDQPKVQWKCLMFKKAARPKAYFAMWLMLHRNLLTTDRLSKWGMNVSKTCVLCQTEDESIEHLLIQCQFSIRLWNRLVT